MRTEAFQSFDPSKLSKLNWIQDLLEAEGEDYADDVPEDYADGAEDWQEDAEEQNYKPKLKKKKKKFKVSKLNWKMR